MVCRMEGPEETASMLKPMDPVVAEVSGYEAEDAPCHRGKIPGKTKLKESELRTDEAENRCHKQKLVQPAAIVKPIRYILQKTPSAILRGSSAGSSFQKVNNEIKNEADSQSANAPANNGVQSWRFKQPMRYLSPQHCGTENLVYTTRTPLVNLIVLGS